jgi:catechol 2,3-dioxygenase-like lactoylglutathione lyase family enzyme
LVIIEFGIEITAGQVKIVKLYKLSPILWTKELTETISFYETILGFSSSSNFPNFATLTKDGVEIMFVVPQDEIFDPLLTGSLFIVTDDVDKLWESLKDKVTVKSSIANREYLMRDFSILDNNGYELVFGQDISGSVSKH